MYDCQASVSTQQKEDRKKKCRKAATSVHTTWAGRAKGTGQVLAGSHPSPMSMWQQLGEVTLRPAEILGRKQPGLPPEMDH